MHAWPLHCNHHPNRSQLSPAAEREGVHARPPGRLRASSKAAAAKAAPRSTILAQAGVPRRCYLGSGFLGSDTLLPVTPR